MRFHLSLLWRAVVAVVMLAAVPVGIMLIIAGIIAFTVSDAETAYDPGSERFVVLVVGFCLPVLWFFFRHARRDIRQFREELGAFDEPASESNPDIAEMTKQLAQQATIPAPTVYIADRSRAESYAFGDKDDGTIVVTDGLVEQLSEKQFRTVLAHEISHLVNGDSRIMGLALAPMLVAEQLHPGDFEIEDSEGIKDVGFEGYFLYSILYFNLLFISGCLQMVAQLGIATLSRGRELAADRGAARLTGSPASLASALETLENVRERPGEDKRTWKKSASALDILPPEKVTDSWRGFRTHPDTETRIQRLEALVDEMETTASATGTYE